MAPSGGCKLSLTPKFKYEIFGLKQYKIVYLYLNTFKFITL